MTININLAQSVATVDIGIPDLEARIDSQSTRIDALAALIAALLPRIETILSKENLIMATQQEQQKALLEALNQIDAATTEAAGNLQIIVTTGQTVATEMGALKQALADAGVQQALVDQAGSVSTRAQTFSTSLAGFVPFLQQIATDAASPVPVPVPAPAPAPASTVEPTPAP